MKMIFFILMPEMELIITRKVLHFSSLVLKVSVFGTRQWPILLPWTIEAAKSPGTKTIQLFRKRLSEKVNATIPKGIVGDFEITVLHRNFERMAREAMDYVTEC